MKVFIWILCAIGFTMANELLGMLVGLKLGYVLLYLLCAGVAALLCRAMDGPGQKKSKSQPDYAAVQQTAAQPQGAAAPVSQRRERPITTVVPGKKEKRKPNKNLICAIAGVVAAVVLVSVLLVVPAAVRRNRVTRAIEAIGAVSMESREAIEEAEALYKGLSESAKEKIENYPTLAAARTEYDRLNDAVQQAKASIFDIGTVTHESGEKIEAARTAYDALEEDNLQSYVAEEYATLKTAESEYAVCREKYLYSQATQAYEQEDYDGAVTWFQKLLDEYPDSSNVSAAKSTIQDACAALSKQALDAGKLEQAQKHLKAGADLGAKTEAYVKAEDALQTKLDRIRPVNGKKLTNKIAWGYCRLTIKGAEDCDVLVKVTSTTKPESYALLYIRAGEEAYINLVNDSYTCKYTAGTSWFGTEEMFGEDAVYAKINNTFSCNTQISGGYIYYRNFTYDMPSTMSSMNRNLSASEF